MMRILETKNLTAEFDGYRAISDLNFSLNKGELRVVLGPNGAGKTTLLDLITGRVKPANGSVSFQAKDITGLDSSSISRLGIGRKFQGPNIFDSLTVLENIDVAYKEVNNVFQSLFFKKSKLANEFIEEIIEKIGLQDRKNVEASILSHGEKQWLEMGMVLAQDPELIILDEPTTGMTAEETFTTGEIVKTIFKDRTVLVVEHDMAFVRQVAEDVTVLHQGQLLAEGSLAEIEANREVQEVYLGEDGGS